MQNKITFSFLGGFGAVVLVLASDVMADTRNFSGVTYLGLFAGGSAVGFVLAALFSKGGISRASDHDDFVPLLDRIRKKKKHED